MNDNMKDYAEAKRDKKHLVSPYWLEACLESNIRVPEDKYPVNFNPRMSIDVAKTRITRSKVQKLIKFFFVPFYDFCFWFFLFLFALDIHLLSLIHVRSMLLPYRNHL